MIFPAYMQGGWPQCNSTELHHLVFLIYDIGKSYTPAVCLPGHFLLYHCYSERFHNYVNNTILKAEDTTKHIKEKAYCRVHVSAEE